MEKRKRKIEKRSSINFGGMDREFSAGGVVFKKVTHNDRVLWLLTRSMPSKLFPKASWRLPKGWLDDRRGGRKPGPMASGKVRAMEEDLMSASLREVKEEAGVDAKILKKLGTEAYFFTVSRKKIIKFVTFYLMEWLKDLPQGPGPETSEVVWLEFEDARKKLSYPREKKVLDKAKEALDSGLQENLL